MLSKALVKSIKLMASGVWNSLHFSMMRRIVNICSAQERLGRNPACCSCNSLSTASRMRFRITWQYTFPGMDRSVTPLQLSHSVRLPFLGIQTTAPFLQSSGTSPEFQTWLQSWYIHLTIHTPLALSISAVIPSIPGDLLFFRFSIAFQTSSSIKSPDKRVNAR